MLTSPPALPFCHFRLLSEWRFIGIVTLRRARLAAFPVPAFFTPVFPANRVLLIVGPLQFIAGVVAALQLNIRIPVLLTDNARGCSLASRETSSYRFACNRFRTTTTAIPLVRTTGYRQHKL
jgi:hypothetical protein